jgi:hypothetical protein
MRRSRKLIAMMMALLMTFAFGLAACGTPAEEADDGGQNPVMNFIGTYVCGRAAIEIGATEGKGATAEVTWSSSAAENSVWTMSGTFDPETLQFEYHDGVRTDYVYDESGEVKSQEEVYTGGHGFMTFTEDPITLTWQEDQEHVADDMVFEYASAAPEEGEEVGMPNPWSDVASLEEAAAGAGIDGFSIPEGAEISLGEVKLTQERCMKEIDEEVVEYPAVEMTIRKGNSSVAENGDISGDYGEYANTWEQNIKGLVVTCFGNRKGEATKTIWQVDDTCFSITAYGMGGDEDYGLSPDDINSLINGIQ